MPIFDVKKIGINLALHTNGQLSGLEKILKAFSNGERIRGNPGGRMTGLEFYHKCRDFQFDLLDNFQNLGEICLNKIQAK